MTSWHVHVGRSSLAQQSIKGPRWVQLLSVQAHIGTPGLQCPAGPAWPAAGARSLHAAAQPCTRPGKPAGLQWGVLWQALHPPTAPAAPLMPGLYSEAHRAGARTGGFAHPQDTLRTAGDSRSQQLLRQGQVPVLRTLSSCQNSDKRSVTVCSASRLTWVKRGGFCFEGHLLAGLVAPHLPPGQLVAVLPCAWPWLCQDPAGHIGVDNSCSAVL